MRLLPLLGLTLLTAGCCSPDPLTRPKPTGTPVDALLDADVSAVTSADLAAKADQLAEHYWLRSQADGIAFEPLRSDRSLAEPDGYGKGGDAALFTGYALAAFSLQAAHTGSEQALQRALASLRGLYTLTHVAGRGVIARCAFPTAQAERWGYPKRWRSRIEVDRAFVGRSKEPIPGPALGPPLNAPIPPSTYYLRGTKDQLTGIVFGLSVAWHVLPEHPAARATIVQIMRALRDHLVDHEWLIRDRKGRNATNADSVSGLLRTQFMALYRLTSGRAAAQSAYEDVFEVGGLGTFLHVFNNVSEYFAHNLRAARSFSAWLLETDGGRKEELADYYADEVWVHVAGHQSPWFATLAAAIDPTNVAARTEARAALASLSLRPLRLWPSPYAGQRYDPPGLLCALFGDPAAFALPPHLRKPFENFLDTKSPWRVGQRPRRTPPEKDTLGLDFLLPYWLARYCGVL